MIDRYDLLMINGLLLISLGLGMIYWPLFFISLGVWLVGIGLVGARNSGFSN